MFTLPLYVTSQCWKLQHSSSHVRHSSSWVPQGRGTALYFHVYSPPFSWRYSCRIFTHSCMSPLSHTEISQLLLEEITYTRFPEDTSDLGDPLMFPRTTAWGLRLCFLSKVSQQLFEKGLAITTVQTFSCPLGWGTVFIKRTYYMEIYKTIKKNVLLQCNPSGAAFTLWKMEYKYAPHSNLQQHDSWCREKCGKPESGVTGQIRLRNV